MDYQEKLKLAKEALDSPFYDKDTIEYIFPELKESEDEKIRKTLIDLIKHNEKSGWKSFNNVPTNSMIAWLEKQSEQPTDKCECCNNVKGCITCTDGDQWAHIEEQKPADKIEPKFKVGDWIIRSAEGFKHNTYLVTEVKDYYVCEEPKGGRVTFTFNDVHKNFKLWDISDAKDGDVLCCENGWTCIFKALDSDISFSSYCFMDSTGWFCETGSESHTLEKAFIKAYSGNIYPATKKQRDLLFQKMKEAGYEWDFEKKELRKIDTRENLILDGDLMAADCMIVEQKPAWSEEDEKIMKRIDSLLYSQCTIHGSVYEELHKWLKFVKERIKGE